MTVYVVEAKRNFETVVVDVSTEPPPMAVADGWEFDALEHRLYGRHRWTRRVPHDSPEPHTVTAWQVPVVLRVDGARVAAAVLAAGAEECGVAIAEVTDDGQAADVEEHGPAPDLDAPLNIARRNEQRDDDADPQHPV